MADRISVSVTRTKKPTGLSVTRNGNNFTFSWKIGDADYGSGQILQYIWSKKPGGKWVDVNIGAKTTKKVVTIPASSFNPSTGKALDWVKFRVAGCRKPHTKNRKQYYYSFSQFAEKTYDVKAPNRPSLSAELSGSAANVTTFTWATTAKTDAAEWLASVQCQTRLERNCTQTDGSKLSATGWTNYNATAAASGSAVITEDRTVSLIVHFKSAAVPAAAIMNDTMSVIRCTVTPAQNNKFVTSMVTDDHAIRRIPALNNESLIFAIISFQSLS